MLIFNIKRALRLRGIEHHHQFLKKLGFATSSIDNFLNGIAVQVKYDQLERLCLALNCTPNDLFEWQPEAEQRVAETHSLNSLRKKDLTQMLGEIPLEKFDQIANILQNLQT